VCFYAGGILVAIPSDKGNGADADLYAFGPDAARIVCEVTARASCEGFMTLKRWLGGTDDLFLDRADPLVMLRG
jgi:hypothetical protein